MFDENPVGTKYIPKSISYVIDKIKLSGLVLYGAGHWGGVAENVFKALSITPQAICDIDCLKQGRFFKDGKISESGVPILSLDEAAELYPQAIYMVTVMMPGAGSYASDEALILLLKKRGLSAIGFDFQRYVFLLEGAFDEIEISAEEVGNKFKAEHLNNIVMLHHMSNSGSTLFGTLLNGHKNILDVPMLGHWVQIENLCESRLTELSKKELAVEIADLLRNYLATEQNVSRFSSTHCNEYGEQEKRILLESRKFIGELYALISECEHISGVFLMKAIYAAYANSIGKKHKPGEEYWMLYDRHRLTFDGLDKVMLSENFKRVEYMFIIREPVQHLNSLLKRFIIDGFPGARLRLTMGSSYGYLAVLSSDMGVPLELSAKTKNMPIKIVRFEDLKTNLEGTLRAVCGVLDIPFDGCLLETSVNGIPVYFPASWKKEDKAVVSTRDNTALNRRDFSLLMTSYDVFRLNLAFRRFKLAMGYDCDVPDPSDFSAQFLRELYSLPFKFEETIDMAGKEALERERLLPGEQVGCHDNIAELFIENITREDKPEFFSDIIRPQGARDNE